MGGHAPTPLLALEDREDLVVEWDTERDRPVFVHSRVRGLAGRVTLDGPHAFLSNPSPEDVTGVLRGEPQRGHGTTGPVPQERIDPDAAAESVRRLLQAAADAHPEARAFSRLVAFEQRVWLARPGDAVIEDVRRGCRLRVEARLPARAGVGDAAAAVEEAALHGDSRDAGIEEKLALRAVARADERRRARPIESGPRRIVFAPGTGGILVHELIGHALEADRWETSWLAGSEDDRVAAPHVQVVDDPRRGRSAWRYDDEGVPARAVPLLRDGRVASRLHDLRSASLHGARPTGHGRRAAFRDRIRPRMGCTFLAPGPFEADEILGEVRDGIYVLRMEVASVDPRSGRAVFRVTDADRLVNGRRGRPLSSHLLRVDGKAALSTVDRVARDLAFDRCIGSCLRDGQPLAVSVGGPTFGIGLTSAQF